MDGETAPTDDPAAAASARPAVFLSTYTRVRKTEASSIDRWRASRYIVWLKNFIAPPGTNRPWAECVTTGYPPDRPAWLTVWLLIVIDNLLHVLCNGLALSFA